MQINARFWIWWRGGWVKLTLRRGDTFRAYCGASHDEGYSATEETYRFDGTWVTCRTETWGRDCDGRYESTRVERFHVLDSRARLNELEHRPPGGGGVPRWREVSARQRDYSAEAAGY